MLDRQRNRNTSASGRPHWTQVGNDEQYSDVAERLLPDIIVEDDCASIGGEKEMTYPRIRPSLKTRIKSIVVREGLGIDHLPDEIENLADYSITSRES